VKRGRKRPRPTWETSLCVSMIEWYMCVRVCMWVWHALYPVVCLSLLPEWLIRRSTNATIIDYICMCIYVEECATASAAIGLINFLEFRFWFESQQLLICPGNVRGKETCMGKTLELCLLDMRDVAWLEFMQLFNKIYAIKMNM